MALTTVQRSDVNSILRRSSVDRLLRVRYEHDFNSLPATVAAYNTANDGVTTGAEAQVLIRSRVPALFLSGTSAAAAFRTGGGVRLTTGTSDNDFASLGTNGVVITGVNSGNAFDVSGFQQLDLLTQKRPAFEAYISLAQLTACGFFFGLASYGTTIPVANELGSGLGNEAAIITFDTDSTVNATNFRSVIRTAGGTAIDTRVSSVKAVADKIYKLRVELTEARVPLFSINDTAIGTGIALTNNVSLKPWIGVCTRVAATAKSADVFYAAVERNAF